MSRFPFPPGHRECPAGPYALRLAEEPLGFVAVPSGHQVRLAVRYDDVAEILSDPRFSRELLYPGAPRFYPDFDMSDAPDVLINMDPPRHSRIRRLVAGTFTARQVEAWRPRVRALAHAAVDALAGPEADISHCPPASPKADFVATVAVPFPVQVICQILGISDFDHARVRGWSESIVGFTGLSFDEKLIEALEFAGYIIELIQRHRADPGDELLSALIQAHDEDGALTDAELVRVVQGLILAGHESTTATLARAVLRLLAPRDRYQRLVERPELVGSAAEEILRVEVPGDTAFLRVAVEDVDLPSGTVRAGEAVLACLMSANHDPAAFADPHRLDLERTGRPHLTFGRGPHYCLGASLARMELQEMLSVLVERVPDLALAEDPDEIAWYRGWSQRPERVLVTVRKDGP